MKAAEAYIENGDIVIRLPIANLPMAVELMPNSSGMRVTDAAVFAPAVVNALNDDDEIGMSAIHQMFDAAFVKAFEGGAEGVTEGVTEDED